MLQTLTRDENQELRTYLCDSGYNTDSLIRYFGRIENPKVHLLKLSIVDRSLPPSPLHTLFRWFWVGSPVDAGLAHATVPARILELLLKSGMVAEGPDGYISAVRISLFQQVADPLGSCEGAHRRATGGDGALAESDIDAVLSPVDAVAGAAVRSTSARERDFGLAAA